MTNDDIFADFISGQPSRPAYATFVEPTEKYQYGRELITWGVMDRRNPGAAVVNGLTEEQAEKIATYLNTVSGALEE
ncbi:hypothetical protein [Rhizobium cremeum]|uniref:hypothetical protein n=1 Tax=Rhizobium cremeum TaxID=2813827 RepID=UPI0039E1CC42